MEELEVQDCIRNVLKGDGRWVDESGWRIPCRILKLVVPELLFHAASRDDKGSNSVLRETQNRTIFTYFWEEYERERGLGKIPVSDTTIESILRAVIEEYTSSSCSSSLKGVQQRDSIDLVEFVSDHGSVFEDHSINSPREFGGGGGCGLEMVEELSYSEESDDLEQEQEEETKQLPPMSNFTSSLPSIVYDESTNTKELFQLKHMVTTSHIDYQQGLPLPSYQMLVRELYISLLEIKSPLSVLSGMVESCMNQSDTFSSFSGTRQEDGYITDIVIVQGCNNDDRDKKVQVLEHSDIGLSANLSRESSLYIGIVRDVQKAPLTDIHVCDSLAKKSLDTSLYEYVGKISRTKSLYCKRGTGPPIRDIHITHSLGSIPLTKELFLEYESSLSSCYHAMEILQKGDQGVPLEEHRQIVYYSRLLLCILKCCMDRNELVVWRGLQILSIMQSKLDILIPSAPLNVFLQSLLGYIPSLFNSFRKGRNLHKLALQICWKAVMYNIDNIYPQTVGLLLQCCITFPSIDGELGIITSLVSSLGTKPHVSETTSSQPLPSSFKQKLNQETVVQCNLLLERNIRELEFTDILALLSNNNNPNLSLCLIYLTKAVLDIDIDTFTSHSLLSHVHQIIQLVPCDKEMTEIIVCLIIPSVLSMIPSSSNTTPALSLLFPLYRLCPLIKTEWASLLHCGMECKQLTSSMLSHIIDKDGFILLYYNCQSLGRDILRYLRDINSLDNLKSILFELKSDANTNTVSEQTVTAKENRAMSWNFREGQHQAREITKKESIRISNDQGLLAGLQYLSMNCTEQNTMKEMACFLYKNEKLDPIAVGEFLESDGDQLWTSKEYQSIRNEFSLLIPIPLHKMPLLQALGYFLNDTGFRISSKCKATNLMDMFVELFTRESSLDKISISKLVSSVRLCDKLVREFGDREEIREQLTGELLSYGFSVEELNVLYSELVEQPLSCKNEVLESERQEKIVEEHISVLLRLERSEWKDAFPSEIVPTVLLNTRQIWESIYKQICTQLVLVTDLDKVLLMLSILEEIYELFAEMSLDPIRELLKSVSLEEISLAESESHVQLSKKVKSVLELKLRKQTGLIKGVDVSFLSLQKQAIVFMNKPIPCFLFNTIFILGTGWTFSRPIVYHLGLLQAENEETNPNSLLLTFREEKHTISFGNEAEKNEWKKAIDRHSVSTIQSILSKPSEDKQSQSNTQCKICLKGFGFLSRGRTCTNCSGISCKTCRMGDTCLLCL